MRQLILVFCGAAAVLVGCLFPSFDDLQSNGAAPAPADDDDATEDSGKPKPDAASGSSSSGQTSSSSGTTTSSSSSSGQTSSSSSSSGTTTTRSIHCRDKTCTGDTICCAPTTGEYTCQPRSNPDCGSNDIAECDGAKDCAPGEVCCQAGPGGGGAACRTGSCGSSDTYCQPDDSACPGTQTCSANSIIGPDGFKVCQ
jgi:hypothetical protein